MAKRTRKGQPVQHTAYSAKRAHAAAERILKRPPPPHDATHYVDLTPAEVTTQAELFQPRRFSDLIGLDEKHVNKLATRIGRKGELDPIIVVRLGQDWVCVDGHHRVAAYRKQKWAGTIKCVWFDGTVRAAADEQMSRNEVAKLEIPQSDRFEEAWRRTLMDWGSKRDVVRITNVSDGMVAFMRRVKRRYQKGSDKFAQEFRAKLGPLEKATWSTASMTYRNISPAEQDIRTRAEMLARALTSRMTNRLSKDPEVTAMALALYDRDLPQPLTFELQKHVPKLDGDADEDMTTTPRAALVHMSDEKLLEALDRNQDNTAYLARQRSLIMQEQDRRAAGGTASDVTWEKWIEEAQNDVDGETLESDCDSDRAGDGEHAGQG